MSRLTNRSYRRMADPTYQRSASCKAAAGSFVRSKLAFTGAYVSMLDGGYGRRWYGEWLDHGTAKARYVVYSYGDHWPLYIYFQHFNVWFGNSESYGYGTATRQHARDLAPERVDGEEPCVVMRRLAQISDLDFVKSRVLGRLVLSRAA